MMHEMALQILVKLITALTSSGLVAMSQKRGREWNTDLFAAKKVKKHCVCTSLHLFQHLLICN